MDTIELKLPISEKVVIIRNYTTRKDDARSEAALYSGVNAKQEVGKDAGIDFPLANVMNSNAVYVKCLVQSIDGDAYNIEDQLGELRSEDYDALNAEVTRIVDEHSPKAKEAKSASKNNNG